MLVLLRSPLPGCVERDRLIVRKLFEPGHPCRRAKAAHAVRDQLGTLHRLSGARHHACSVGRRARREVAEHHTGTALLILFHPVEDARTERGGGRAGCVRWLADRCLCARRLLGRPL